MSYETQPARCVSHKLSTKSMSKRRNNITLQRFKAALNGSVDRKRRVLSGHRSDDYLVIAETGAERLLRQTLGAARLSSSST